jgi:hypothetical protein
MFNASPAQSVGRSAAALAGRMKVVWIRLWVADANRSSRARKRSQATSALKQADDEKCLQ